LTETSTTTPEIAGASKGELPPEDNTSGGESDEPETVKPYPIPLSDLEVTILESTSFLTFRKRYRAFLFPPSNPKLLETGIPTDDDVPALDSGPLGPRIRSGLEQEGNVYLLYNLVAFVLGWVRRFLRSPVKRGQVRIEWTCVSQFSLLYSFSLSGYIFIMYDRIAATTSTPTSWNRMATQFKTWSCFSRARPTIMEEEVQPNRIPVTLLEDHQIRHQHSRHHLCLRLCSRHLTIKPMLARLQGRNLTLSLADRS
jgi:hypothetical protein